MKKYINILLMAFMVLAAASCSKEALFDDDAAPAGEGRLLTDALSVSIANENGLRNVHGRYVRRAPEADDFTVSFFREGSDTPEASYKYSEMPEIITLPAGAYTAAATYGDNPAAAWESPYYKGEVSFQIVADEITDRVDPIVCKFANVRVSIDFDQKLREAMSADSKVSVKVGDSGSLDFTLADVERSGYFAYVEDSHTLAATFSGNIGGSPSSETKAYDDVQPGTHYKITFRLHDAGEEDPGFIGGDDIVVVDASVVSEDMNVDVPSGEKPIEDDLRPKEDEGSDDPTPPTPGKEAPTVTAQAPYELDKVNEVELVEGAEGKESKYPVVLVIDSKADGGITEFTVKIDSNTLTSGELEGVGLTDKFDLVNPGEYGPTLAGFGLPVNVGGETHVECSITKFVPLLALLGPGTHKFIVTVSDANGTTSKTLILHNN